MEYAIIGILMVVIAAVAVAFFQGKSSGASKVENKTLKEIDSVQDKQLEAANQDRSPSAIADSLHNRNF